MLCGTRHDCHRMSFSLPTWRNSMRAARIAFALFVAGYARHVGAQCSMRWDAPRVLEVAGGRPAYVESPAAVPTKGGVLLLGVPAMIWAERDAFDPFPSPSALDTAAYLARLQRNIGYIGFVLQREHTVTGVRPPAAGPMRRLVAVSSADGTTHVAGFAPPPGSNDPDAEGSIWYAEYHAGQWTVPTMVYSADRLGWSGLKGALLIGKNSDVHMVVDYTRGQSQGIAYIRRTNGRWTTTEIVLGGMPSQATAQLIGTDSLAVAFAGIGAPGVRGRNGQHVFLIRAAIADTVWPTPTLVHYSGLERVWSLGMHALSSTQGTSSALAMVWVRHTQSSPSTADSLYAMISEDGGVTWRSPQILPLPFKVASLTQARDARGNVHVVVTSSDVLGATNARMYHAALIKGRWTSVDSLADTVESMPTLSPIAPDSLLLVYGAARPADAKLPGLIAPVSKYATLVTACPR